MQNSAIIGTGLTGLVGSRVVELLSDKYAITNISRSTGVDILNSQQVHEAIAASDAEVVIHMAAKTDVDGCEKDKERDTEILEITDKKEQEACLIEEKTAWALNVVGTRNVAQACERTQKKLIFISTDFVFNGTKAVYTEEDTPGPLNWYATTKFEGEKIVQKLSSPWIIVRFASPYRAQYDKPDFMRAIKTRLETNQTVMGITDHLFTPTYIDDIANAFDALITQQATGIYHVVGSQSLTPYAAACLIADAFGLSKELIQQTTREAFFAGRAVRPFQLALRNGKIGALGVEMRTFEAGLLEIKNQLH